ncbi:unnamed protein product, partial [Amoebophrya sp. A25]
FQGGCGATASSYEDPSLFADDNLPTPKSDEAEMWSIGMTRLKIFQSVKGYLGKMLQQCVGSWIDFPHDEKCVATLKKWPAQYDNSWHAKTKKQDAYRTSKFWCPDFHWYNLLGDPHEGPKYVVLGEKSRALTMW